MAPAKVTDAFQATKRGRGVAKGKAKAKPVRAADTKPENDNTEEYLTILKSFDMTSKFGPALGLTRLERWERAEKLELSPPADVLRILQEVGEDDPEVRECVWERIV